MACGLNKIIISPCFSLKNYSRQTITHVFFAFSFTRSRRTAHPREYSAPHMAMVRRSTASVMTAAVSVLVISSCAHGLSQPKR